MGNKKNKEALLAEGIKEALLAEGIKETLNVEKCFRIHKEITTALCEIIDKYTDKEDLGIMETVIGTTLSLAKFMCMFATVHEPMLNPDMLIKTAAVILENYNTKEDMDELENMKVAILKDKKNKAEMNHGKDNL